MTDESKEIVRAHVWVTGRVQGVAYRAYARRVAMERGLTGGVRNLEDGRVEIEVQGPRGAVEAFFESLRKGPPLARVADLEISWRLVTGGESGFAIWY